MSSSIRIETIDNPVRYTPEQLARARRLAEFLARGRLILCEMPGR